MATLAVQKAVPDGIIPTLAAATSGGDKFPASRRNVLRVKNAHASIDTTVTFVAQRDCDQGFSHDHEVTVVHGTEEDIGNLDPHRFADGDGYINVTYTSVTTVTVGVLGT